jgi:hypothetical protein
MAQRQLFDDVFNASTIYQMLFFNVKSVLIYPTLDELKEKNKPMFERWKYFSESKFGVKFSDTDLISDEQIATYSDNAPNYPEFSKIVAITYATAYSENGEIKRHISRIGNEDECLILAEFIEVLNVLSKDESKKQFPILCGHNIIGHDIPLLIKRLLLYRDRPEIGKKIPAILKNSLNIKPWESGILDTVNVWKFNGYDNVPLMMIADYLGFKKTVDLLPNNKLSKYYWDNIKINPTDTMKYIQLQSATQVNLVIKLLDELRQL